MPAPKATSHGLYGAAGATALTFMSAASAGVASATAATADKMTFLIFCPSINVHRPGGLLVQSNFNFPQVAPAAGQRSARIQKSTVASGNRRLSPNPCASHGLSDRIIISVAILTRGFPQLF